MFYHVSAGTTFPNEKYIELSRLCRDWSWKLKRVSYEELILSIMKNLKSIVAETPLYYGPRRPGIMDLDVIYMSCGISMSKEMLYDEVFPLHTSSDEPTYSWNCSDTFGAGESNDFSSKGADFEIGVFDHGFFDDIEERNDRIHYWNTAHHPGRLTLSSVTTGERLGIAMTDWDPKQIWVDDAAMYLIAQVLRLPPPSWGADPMLKNDGDMATQPPLSTERNILAVRYLPEVEEGNRIEHSSRVHPTAAAVTECRKWLSEESRQPKRGPKDSYFRRAKDRFGSRISRRGFERAWAETVPAEWKTSGRLASRKSTH